MLFDSLKALVWHILQWSRSNGLCASISLVLQFVSEFISSFYLFESHKQGVATIE